MTDYIPREAAIELGKKQSCAGIIDGGDFCNISANMLRNIPAADVVEQKHGTWYWLSTIFRSSYCCTNCQKRSPYEFDYCPNCGAKMDGGKKDG